MEKKGKTLQALTFLQVLLFCFTKLFVLQDNCCFM